MADDKISFSLDLDAAEFQEAISKAGESLAKLGEAGSLDGLISSIGSMLGPLALVTAAIMAVKTALDLTTEAENIQRVQKQFDILTERAGISSQAMIDGMREASKGLIDETDLMKAANGAMVELGVSSDKIPELMELATKATQVYGGSALQNFEGISQAVATGNTRMLKHLGIVIDQEKAYKDYAAQLGVAVSVLSEQEKKQAILNATLERGKKSFDGIDVNTETATSTMQQLSVAVKEVGETIAIVFERVAGPTVRKFLSNLTEGVKSFKDSFVGFFGTGTEKDEAKTRSLQKELDGLQKRLETLKAGQTGVFSPELQGQIEITKKKIEEDTAALDALTKKTKEASAAKPEKPAAEKEDTADYGKRLAQESKFQEDLYKIKDSMVARDMKNAQNEEEVNSATIMRKLYAEKELAAEVDKINSSSELSEIQKEQKIAAIKQEGLAKQEELDQQAVDKKLSLNQKLIDGANSVDAWEKLLAERKTLEDEQYALRRTEITNNDILTEQQKNMALEEAAAQHQVVLDRLESDGVNKRSEMMMKEAQAANNAAVGWAKGFAAASAKNRDSLRNFAQQGSTTFAIFGNSASNAFMKLGEGAEKGSQVAKEAALGMVADIAQYYGQMLLLASVWPPNPVGLAAGAGLLVLAGFLRAQAKGKSSLGGGTSVGGMEGIGGGVGSIQTTDTAQQAQKDSKSVTLNVQGNLFDTDSTRRRITEIMREEMDATDFKYQKIGGGV